MTQSRRDQAVHSKSMTLMNVNASFLFFSGVNSFSSQLHTTRTPYPIPITWDLTSGIRPFGINSKLQSFHRLRERSFHFQMDTPSNTKGIAIVLMGVSGSGKSTIGQMLAKVTNCSFLDADDYHPESNKEKMKNGIPLSDNDRIPWLQVLRDALRLSLTNGLTVILACSALQRHYRDILRSGDPNYRPNCHTCAVKFVLLDVGAEILASRLEKRAAEGQHFMSPKLLQSQLHSLEIDESEGILKVDAALDPEVIVNIIRSSFS